MNVFLRFAPALIVLGSGLLAVAGQSGGDAPQCHAQACRSSGLLTGCPDDYCRKPTPRVVCLPCGQPGDYCRKSLPRIWRLPCGETDEYCRKPWPHVCRPLRPEHYHCGQQAH